jgi:hypothetical protein
MKIIKCDKCSKFFDEEFAYEIKMPFIYGAPRDKLKVCTKCFRRMWESFESDEYGKRIFN